MFFLGVPCRLISFFIVYKVLLASSLAGVYFYTGVAAGVIGRAYLVQVLLAVTAVHKVGV
jgi:hypothetical protein